MTRNPLLLCCCLFSAIGCGEADVEHKRTSQELLDRHVNTRVNQDPVAHIHLLDRETRRAMERQAAGEIVRCQQDAERAAEVGELLSLKRDPAKLQPIELLVARMRDRFAKDTADWKNARLVSARSKVRADWVYRYIVRFKVGPDRLG